MSARGPWDPKRDDGRAESSRNGVIRPVLPEARSTWLTYETFYGLREQPFNLSSNPKFFYHSRSHAATFDDLLAGIRRRERLSVLTGDIGTGKTTLCRTVLESLDRKTFSAFVPDPFVSREDLLKVLLMDFGVVSVDDATSGRLKGASRTELSYLLYQFLDTLVPLQAFAVVVIDEAQNLSLPLLEEIRILSDSEGRERQLQVVLVGQLELQQKLKLPEMRQVDQRVSVRCNLEPLGSDAVAGYVAHRLQVAGGSPDRVSFSPEALDVVYQVSGGVPRLINRICDRALHHGHLRHAAIVDREILEAAIPDLGRNAPEGAPNAASAAQPASADAGSAQSPDPTSFFERVDDCLTTTNREAKAGAVAAPGRSRADRTGAADQGGSLFVPGATTKRRNERFGLDASPRTHIERLTRRLLRALAVVVLGMIGLGAAAAGFSYLLRLSAELAAPPLLPNMPSKPPMAMPSSLSPPVPPEILSLEAPARGQFLIEVALFKTSGRARALVEELAQTGYRAYVAKRDLGDRGVWQQVLIGPYATRAEADADLERLHRVPGYDDARAVEVPPSPTAR